MQLEYTRAQTISIEYLRAPPTSHAAVEPVCERYALQGQSVFKYRVVVQYEVVDCLTGRRFARTLRTMHSPDKVPVAWSVLELPYKSYACTVTPNEAPAVLSAIEVKVKPPKVAEWATAK